VLTVAMPFRVVPGYEALHNYVDQINVMAYDLSGCWGSPDATWHNAPLYNTSALRDPYNAPFRNVDAVMAKWKALYPANKLAIGIPFYGFVYGGFSAPNQTWTGAPPVCGQIPYRTLVSGGWLNASYKRWDNGAAVPYLSVPAGAISWNGTTSQKYVTYDDPASIAEKVKYARQTGLGGVMVWLIGNDRLSSNPMETRYPLQSALRAAVFAP
jgi:chitinase